MTVALLKPDPVAPDLGRLGELVLAVQARLSAPGAGSHWAPWQVDWPETKALAQSIENDDGWDLFAAMRGWSDEKLVLYLDAPQLFLRSYNSNVTVWPGLSAWSHTLSNVVFFAKRARQKRLGRLPAYTDDVLLAMRERRQFRWGDR